MGSKKEHLELATKEKYDRGRVLMIGDAPGDLKAARANAALFYPILPGREDDSWEKLYGEMLDLFFTGRYGKELESSLIEEFEACLPHTPPWVKRGGKG